MRFVPRFRGIAVLPVSAAVLGGLACTESTGPKTIEPPTGVTVTMASPTAARITWTASAQADLVVSYNIFRNGTKVGESTAILYQDDGLAEGTLYKYAISANGKDGQVSALSAESPSSSITPPDVTAPRVISSSPADGVTGVLRAATISVTFSEPIDPASINTSTFQVKVSSADAIAGTVTYTAGTRTAQFTPSSNLPNAASISVGITTGVKDLAGNPLASAFAFAFAVKDEVKPVVVSVTPLDNATGVPTGASVVAVFSEPMDASTINAATFTLRLASSGAGVAGAVSYDAPSRSATFVPGSGLASGASYTVGISTGARDAAGNALDQPFSSSFTTAAVTDDTPPGVVAIEPSSGATGVPVSAVVSLTFSEPMSPASITEASFTLASGSGAVGGVTSLNSSGTVATFTPSAALQNGTTYTVTATTAMKDLAGNPLTSGFTSTFTTVPSVVVDNTPPTVVSSIPANASQNVAVTSPVRVTFSEEMDASTINASTFVLTVGGAQVTGSVSYDAGSRTATFNPSAGLLAEGQSYTGTVTTGVRDLAGNAMAASFTFSFTTVAPVDNTPPAIVSRSPSPGATGVPTSTTIRIGFSEAMDAATINGSTFTVASGGSPVAGSVSYDAPARVATFTPNAVLSTGVTYTVTVTTGVRDAAGNALAAGDTFTFKTAQTNISGMYGNETWWQTTTRDGAPAESTNPDSASVHIHFVFAQNGDALSLNSECSGASDRCITFPRNAAGQTATGPNSNGYLWVLMTSLTGTLDRNAISFTITNENGRTFSFTGTLIDPYTMTGTISGPTIPTEQVIFRRPNPSP